jgi:hypothetical protein
MCLEAGGTERDALRRLAASAARGAALRVDLGRRRRATAAHNHDIIMATRGPHRYRKHRIDRVSAQQPIITSEVFGPELATLCDFAPTWSNP